MSSETVLIVDEAPANRKLTEQEKGLLEAWMHKADLKPGPYLY